jgi:hypothetical protein
LRERANFCKDRSKVPHSKRMWSRPVILIAASAASFCASRRLAMAGTEGGLNSTGQPLQNLSHWDANAATSTALTGSVPILSLAPTSSNDVVIASGTSLTVNGQTFTASALTNNGTLTLTSGLLNSPTITLNDGSVTSFNGGTVLASVGVTQSGGAFSASNTQIVTLSSGTIASYSLQRGTFTAPVLKIDGGSLNQSGGTTTVAGTLGIGYVGGGSSSYTLSNGLLSNSINEFIGLQGKGTFNQNGGTNSSNGMLVIGYHPNVDGTYLLTNGSLILSNGGNEIVGNFGNGVINQSGGSHTIGNGGFAGSLEIGYRTGSSGTYLLGGGTLSLLNATNETVGDVGNGLFNQSGGSHTIHAGSLYLGKSGTGNGTYTLSDGLLLLDNSSEYIGYSGSGTFNQSGGNHTVSGTLYISYGSSYAGTLALSGGILNAQNVVNQGLFNQTGGIASLLALTGTGDAIIGGSDSATATVSSLSQSSVTVNDHGILTVTQAPTRVTNSIGTLAIAGSGVLDLNNHNLLTNTPEATVRQYLTNGYNADGSGIGRWNGTGGISSSLAAAAYMANPLNPKFSVGYATVADNATTHLGLTGNQVLVKPTIPGDATLDGLVDIGDLNVVLSNYLSGNPARWGTGDFTYAGRTDITDLNIVLSNYFATSPYPSAATPSAKTATSSAATLTGTPVASSATSAPVTANTVELDVDPVSGDVKLNGNGAKIASIQITSNGHLLPMSWNSLGDQGVPNWTDATDRTTTGLAEYDFKFNTKHDSKLINGVIDYGNIFASGAAHDLVFQYGLVQPDGTTLSTITGNVVYAPEPTSLSLLGLGAIGLLKRRNRRTKGN